MIRKIIGKTTILCAAIVITIILVITAWAVTSRFSGKAVQQTPIFEETVLTESESDVPEQIKPAEVEVRQEPAPVKTQNFEQIERDFIAGSSNVRRLDDALSAPSEPEEKPAETLPNQPLTVAQESEVDQVRQEAGKIVDRSGLFSTDQKPEDEAIPKDMDARRTVVSEQKAYQEAKDKVDAMLKSLGYVD